MATNAPQMDLGSKAPGFDLPDPSGKTVTLNAVMGKKGLVVAFLCNHCPYVIAVADRIAETARILAAEEIGFVGIMSNDWKAYPQDAPPRMVDFSKRYGFSFPYVIDETQDVAKAFGAVCTPDFFGFDADNRLIYRGRLDAGGRDTGPATLKRDLVDAMLSHAQNGVVIEEQSPSVGCSIKWRG